MQLNAIGRNWGKIHRGTEIHLLRDAAFPGFEGSRTLKKGKYLIEGFYANAVKLLRGGYYPIGEEYVIPAASLAGFLYSPKDVTTEGGVIKGKDWKRKLLAANREWFAEGGDKHGISV